MNVGIEQLETGYIVTVAEPIPPQQKRQDPTPFSMMIFGYAENAAPQTKLTRYACKSLYEVAGLLEQLFTDSAFVAKDIALCGEVVKAKRTKRGTT